MEWLNQNLDAYRIIAEILHDLRSTLRRHLEAVHGKTWYREGVPQEVLDRLIQSKEREQAIDWYDSEYQEIMDFALFSDLIEIIEHGGNSFPQLTKLAPTQPLLHARFLELEVMRSKIGRARPISDSELAFLTTVHLRFRKALDEIAVAVAAKPDAGEARPKAVAEPSEPAAGPVVTKPAKAAPEALNETQPVKIKATKPPPPPAKPPAAQAPVRAATGSGGAQAAVSTHATAEPADTPQSIAKALADRDDAAILRELYREVTAIAEGIWATDRPPTPTTWPKVSTSAWYEDNISTLGLKPLSDFYETVANVQRRLRDDFSREQLQEFLKEANFAKILLALRDMFQKNKI